MANNNLDSSLVVITKNNGLCTITINNPRKKNAINKAMYTEITNELNKSADDDSIILVTITGVGDFFSSGNDLEDTYTNNNDTDNSTIRDFIHAFIKFPKLLIAIVNGPAIGIASTILPLFDIVYASETAYFYTPFVKLGISAEGCSSYTFPKILGKSKASEMLLLNYKMYANEALQFKFISEIFTPIELNEKLWPKIRALTKLSKESLRVCKKLCQSNEIDLLIKICDNELEELKLRLQSQKFNDNLSKFLKRKSHL